MNAHTTTATLDTDRLLGRVARIAAVLGGLCAVWMGVRAGVGAAVSSALGTLVGLANLWALARLVTRLVDAQVPTGKGQAGALLIGKTAALFAVVGVLVWSGRVDAGAFLGGVTACVVATAAAGLWGDGAAPKSDDNRDGPAEGPSA